MSAADFSIAGLVLNLIGVILLFRYGMPYRVEVKGYSLLLEADPSDDDFGIGCRLRCRRGN